MELPNNIGTKTFAPMGDEPFEGFYQTIAMLKTDFINAFTKANWNIERRIKTDRPLLFGINYDYGCIVIPSEELTDIDREEYTTIINEVLTRYPSLIPFVAVTYKK